MIGNNSCGVHSVMAGKTVDNVEELEILTYDGAAPARSGPTPTRSWRASSPRAAGAARSTPGCARCATSYADLIRARFPDIPRRVSGYNLAALLPENGFDVARALVGTEGTCVLVLEAKIAAGRQPAGARAGSCSAIPTSTRRPTTCRASSSRGPIGARGLRDDLLGASSAARACIRDEAARCCPPGGGWLLVGVRRGGPREEAEDKASGARGRVRARPRPPAVACTTIPRTSAIRSGRLRESGLGAPRARPGRGDDVGGLGGRRGRARAASARYLRDLRALLDRYGYGGDFYGHFGQGCVHTRIDFDLETARGIAAVPRLHATRRRTWSSRYGGSLSGEHGDGQARGELLPKMFGAGADAGLPRVQGDLGSRRAR